MNGANITVSLLGAPIPGNLLIAIVGANNSTTLALPGWTAAIDASGQNAAQAIFFKVVGPSEPTSITATRTGGGPIGLQVSEYTGLATTSPVDQAATGAAGASINRANGPFTCGSVTTNQANELLIAGVANNGSAGTNVNNAWTSSFGELNDLLNSGSSLMIASAHRVVTSAGTYATGSNLQGGTGSGATRCQLVTFRGAP